MKSENIITIIYDYFRFLPKQQGNVTGELTHMFHASCFQGKWKKKKKGGSGEISKTTN